MTNVFSIKMGDLKVASEPAVLPSAGIGSCLAIILYDPVLKTGALAHAMLPHADADHANAVRYVDCAIDIMLTELVRSGTQRGHIVAKLVGGAHMFSLYGDEHSSIGAKNIAEAKRKLSEERIPIASEETGGNVGRNLEFDLTTGVCSVETKM